MKRPLAVIGFTFFVCLAALFLKCGKTRRNVILPAVCITTAVSLFWLMCFNSVYVKPTEELYGKTAVITGEICDLPYENDGRTYYKIETSEIGLPDVVQKTKILVSSSKAIRADLYDTITVTVNIYPQSENLYKYYNISRGNYLTGSIDNYAEIKIKENDSKPLFYYALIIRKHILDTINDQLPKEQAGFVSAVLLADKSGLKEEDKSVFRDAGISHIIAVSGFHLAVITQLMMLFLTFICMGKKRVASFICAGFVFLYMSVVGFTPSVVRAGIMQILFLFGQSISEKADSINSLGLAALIICFINPYSAVDTGFLLSFSATLGIVLWSGRISSFVKRRLYPKDEMRTGALSTFLFIVKTPLCGLISVISASVSAVSFSVPIMLVYFKSFAVYTVLTNICVSAAASVLIFTALIMVFLRISVIFAFLELPFIALTGLLVNYITTVARYISELPFSVIKLSEDFVPICITVSVILFALIFSLYKGKKYIAAGFYIICVTVIFVIGAVTDKILERGSIKISIMDCGDGLTVIMTDKEDVSVLFCGGSYDRLYDIKNYLSDSGIRNINYMLIYGDNKNISGYASDIIEEYDVDNIQVYDEKKLNERLKYLAGECPNVIYGNTGDIETVHMYNTDIHICSTNNSCAMYFELYGNDFLICSKNTDCSFLPKNRLNADYFVVEGYAENFRELSVGRIIVSDTYENIQNDIGMYDENMRDNIYYTAGCGNIALRIYESGSVSVGREGYWLS